MARSLPGHFVGFGLFPVSAALRGTSGLLGVAPAHRHITRFRCRRPLLRYRLFLDILRFHPPIVQVVEQISQSRSEMARPVFALALLG